MYRALQREQPLLSTTDANSDANSPSVALCVSGEYLSLAAQWVQIQLVDASRNRKIDNKVYGSSCCALIAKAAAAAKLVD
jgi:hypothetical protein